MLQNKIHASLACSLAIFLCTLTIAAPVSADSTVNFSGFLSSTAPAAFNSASLQSFVAATPAAAASVSVNGDIYSGVSLEAYIKSYVSSQSGVKNDILRDYIVATDSKGANTVYSLANLLGSGFGVQNDIIAYSDSNGTLAGPAIIAADGANVLNLSSLQVGHVNYTAGVGGVSSQFSIDGAVSNPETFNTSTNPFPGSLVTETISVSVPPIAANTTFTGVNLWDLLLHAGISTDPASLLNQYVIATATDGYQVVYSLEELAPGYGNQNDLLAYQTNGAALGSNGLVRTVVPTDLKAGRFASNITELTVVSVAQVPLPASAFLMLSGLLGLMGGRLLKLRADRRA